MGFNTINTAERELFSLPIKDGGMGIEILADISDAEFDRSVQVTAPLAAIIALQGDELPSREQVEKAKSLMREQKAESAESKKERIDSTIQGDTMRIIQQSRQPGTSNWLSALPPF